MKSIISTILFCAALGCILLPGCSKSKDSTIQSGPRSPTLTEIRNASTEEWFDRIGEKEGTLGYAPFSAMNALIHKAKESDSVKDDIIRKAEDIADDTGQGITRRFQSCYILSGIGDKRGIPTLLRAFDDENPTIRGVAACALGAFDDSCVDAHKALEKAAKTEKNPEVLVFIQKALDGEFLPKIR